MSFDLYVFDLDRLPDGDALFDLLEEGDDGELTPALTALVAELEHRFPSLDDDSDASPWASWPLTQPVADGRGCAFNIVWSEATTMHEVFVAATAERGLLLYDPQDGEVLTSAEVDRAIEQAITQLDEPPAPGAARRSWWRRRG